MELRVPGNVRAGVSASDAHLHVDLGVRLVAGDLKVIGGKVVDGVNAAGKGEAGKRPRVPLQLNCR